MKPDASWFARMVRAAASAGSLLVLSTAPAALAATVLYGGLGGHGISSGPAESTNDGALVIVSQTDGSTTVVGHPAGVARIAGLAFGLDGTLFGATQVGGGYPPPPGPVSTSDLIRIDPATGALISSVPIADGATALSIADLAVHPLTGILYGTGGVGGNKLNGAGRLYAIDTTTGAATFIGDTGMFFASIAFATDGTLYMSAAILNSLGLIDLPVLMTLDPGNAAVIARVSTQDFYHSLAVRPTDRVIFGGRGDQQGVYTIDPATGTATLIGLTGTDFVGDFAFRTSPAGIDANQHGLTGSWYQPATSGQGIELEIYPNAVGPGTGFVQGSWFTYDYTAPGGPASQRWYTFGGNVRTGDASATLVLYQNVGGNFNAPPVTSAMPVGSVVLGFADCATASMAYAFTDGSGRAGTIPLARLTPNVTCAVSGPAPSSADFGYSGNWFAPATAGQGFVFELNPNATTVFFAWYTYAPGGQSQGAAGQRWYTGQASYAPGSRTLPVTLYETTGGLFDSGTPAAHTAPVGMGTVTFASCSAAALTYAFTAGSSAGASGTIELSRVGPTPAGCGA